MKNTQQIVTPEQAAKWLHASINRENRDLRQTHVAYLAREMEEGRWQESHQCIAFSKSGRLLDGQHRLAAIVLYGKPVEILVTTGLPEEAFNVIDCGLKRQNHERIHLVDDKLQNQLICQAVRAFIEQVTKDCQVSVGHIEDEFLTKTDAWMWVGHEFTGIHGRLKKAGIMAAFGVYRFVKPEMAAAFMNGYREGTGLEAGSPVLKLRNDALTGSAHDCRYWRAQSIMRSHLQGKSVTAVYEAAEDMVGNENTAHVVRARTKSALAGAETKKKRGAA